MLEKVELFEDTVEHLLWGLESGFFGGGFDDLVEVALQGWGQVFDLAD